MTETILVSGAAGQLGRAVVHHLLESEKRVPSSLIAATRDPSKLSHLAARGVTVRRVDFDDEATLDPAFAGAQRILIISTDTLDLVGGRRIRQQEAAVRAAQRVGVTHVAYTSQPEPEQSPILFAADHLCTEEAIMASGLAYTIFRANSYHENLLMPLPTGLPAIARTGRWPTAAGEGRVAYAARDDMAAAIAARLAQPTLVSATLLLTGPVAFSNAEVARLVTEVTATPIEMVAVSEEELAKELLQAGVPEPFARTLASGEGHIRAGHAALTNDLIERLSRRRPRSLRAFLEASKSVLLASSR